MATERTKYLELLNRSSLYRLRRIAKSAGLSAEEIVEIVGETEGGEQDAIIKRIMEKYDEAEVELPIPNIREEEEMPRGRPRKKAVEQHAKPITPKPAEEPKQLMEDAMDEYSIFDDDITPEEIPDQGTEYDADIQAPVHQCANMSNDEVLAALGKLNEEVMAALRKRDEKQAALLLELRELAEVVKYSFAHVFKMGAAKPIPGFAQVLEKAKEKAAKK